MSKAMFSKELIGGAFSKLNKWAAGHAKVGSMGDGMGKDVASKIFSTAAKDPSLAGAIYGGGTGAAVGALSSDRDQNWYRGAAQGAFAGYQATKHGLSGRTAIGAGLGALYGMASDDTSIMGGALMGATAVGPGWRHAKKAYGSFGMAGGGKAGLKAGFNRARKDISGELGFKRKPNKGPAGPETSAGQQSQWLRDRGVDKINTFNSTTRLRERTGASLNRETNLRAAALRPGKPPQRNQATGSARPPKPVIPAPAPKTPKRNQATGNTRPSKPVTVNPGMQRKWLRDRGVKIGGVSARGGQSLVNEMRTRNLGRNR